MDLPLSQWKPSKIVEFIGQFVSITTKTLEYEGFVDAIDPVTGSVMLCTRYHNVQKLIIANGHLITNIVVKEAPPECEHKSLRCEEIKETVNLQSAKSHLYKWLIRNMLPVEDIDDVLYVHNGHVIISPPYKAENCVSSNSIILGRIQHLVQNMPKEPIVNEMEVENEETK